MNKEEKKLIKLGFDPEHLKHWKNTSTKAKLQWLSDALEFAHAQRRIIRNRSQ